MLILINIIIQDMELDFILINFFKFSFFLVDMSSSLHADKESKDTLILGKERTQGLDNTTLTAETEYSINFSRSQRKF